MIPSSVRRGLLTLAGALIASGCAPSPAPSGPQSPVAPKAGPASSRYPGMVYVPPGEFIMGSKEQGTLRKVKLAGYYIDIYEVTNEQFKAYVDATGAAPPEPAEEDGSQQDWYGPEKAKLPVVNVTYEQAAGYAQWAGKRLPTEAEWERAARGIDGRTYPWGNEFDRTKCNVSNLGPAPVGSYPGDVSPVGCYDMAGNVTEWTSSWYALPAGAAGLHRYRVVKGGAWDYRVASTKAYARRRVLPDVRSQFIGFRCCRSE